MDPYDPDNKDAFNQTHPDNRWGCHICEDNDKLAQSDPEAWRRYINDWIHEERELRMNEEVNMRQRITDLEQTLKRLKNLL
tara:strand:- start:245 stop:487 length:243 start_codon:yes stop_codon:yes gene_type:complete